MQPLQSEWVFRAGLKANLSRRTGCRHRRADSIEDLPASIGKCRGPLRGRTASNPASTRLRPLAAHGAERGATTQDAPPYPTSPEPLPGTAGEDYPMQCCRECLIHRLQAGRGLCRYQKRIALESRLFQRFAVLSDSAMYCRRSEFSIKP